MKRTRRYRGDKVQFCPQGHDTFICGRSHGHCKKCLKEKYPLKVGAQLGNKNNKPKQFCSKGHDKDVVGKDKRGRCLKCKRINQRKDPTKDSRLKQFCLNKHDTFVCGRVNGMCKICRVEYKKKYGKEHIEDTRKWRETHKEEIKAYNLKYMRGWYLKKQYNLTVEEYADILQEQDEKCIGCQRHYSQFARGLYVDHNHKCCSGDKSCGKCVRGLLCDDCNLLLGRAQDNPETLLRLVKYLNKHKEK